MPPCSKKLCVGVAGPSGLCAAHAAGYNQFDGAGELKCTNCRRKFRKGEWYQTRDGGQFHPHPCEPHKDVVAERAKAADAVKA